jgi:hypothetical protein
MRRLICGLAALTLVAASDLARGADDPPKTTVLFDGKTLDGWKTADFYKADESPVKVEDGAIILPKGKPMAGIVTTRKDLPTVDYELSYEARKLDGKDFFAAATFPVGDKFITFVNGGWGGYVTGLSSLNGADASENETSRSFKYENKTWYKFRVRVTKKTIRAFIDDKPMSAVDYSERTVGTRVEVGPNKPLGFAAYDTVGAIRNISIRPLTASEIAATDKIE